MVYWYLVSTHDLGVPSELFINVHRLSQFALLLSVHFQRTLQTFVCITLLHAHRASGTQVLNLRGRRSTNMLGSDQYGVSDFGT